MAQQLINIGVTANDGTGDTLRDGGDKINANFDELYAAVSGGEGTPLSGVVAGCALVYSGTALTFDLSAGSYYLDGDLLSAEAQQITLDSADASNPRIDVLYLDAAGVLGKITGTPAASPSQPAHDPTTQLYLTFVLVPAAATDLNAGIVDEDIYLENAEWTASQTGTAYTLASASNPYAGTVCIEVTGTLTTGEDLEFERASAMAFDGDGSLTFRIRSKAGWNTKRGLIFQFTSGGAAIGSPVTLRHNTFGFDSSITDAYQLVAIGKSLFAIAAGTEIDGLRISPTGSGGSAIQFHLDNVILQTTGSATGGGSTVSGITQEQADARYLKLTGGTLSGALSVPDDAYGAGWEGSAEVPTKNAVRDAIEAVSGGGGSAALPVVATDADDYTVLAADVNKYIRLTAAGTKLVTVNDDSEEALPANGEWHFRVVGGDATFVEDTNVTINAPYGGTLVVPDGGTVTLKRVAADEFDLFGATVAA